MTVPLESGRRVRLGLPIAIDRDWGPFPTGSVSPVGGAPQRIIPRWGPRALRCDGGPGSQNGLCSAGATGYTCALAINDNRLVAL